MKKVLLACLMTAIMVSCSVEKRHYLSGYYIDKNNGQKNNNEQELNSKKIIKISNKQNNEIDRSVDPIELSKISAVNNVLKKNKIRIKNIEDCDIITLKNGEDIKGKVMEITLTEIKYKKCDNISGPTITLSKSDVFVIKYTNGTKDIINSISETKKSGQTNDYQSDNRKTNGFGIASFVLGLVAGFTYVGSLIGGIVIGVLAVILGIIGIAQISKNPTMLKGKGFAIAGFILGLISAVIFLALLLM